MHIASQILMGVFALALPFGTMAVLDYGGSCQGTAKPDQLHRLRRHGDLRDADDHRWGGHRREACDRHSVTGDVLTALPGHALTGRSTSWGKNTKLAKADPRYNKTAGIKYVTGSQAEFIAAGGTLKKTLKVVNFTVNGNQVQFKTKSAVEVIGGATSPVRSDSSSAVR